MLAGMRAIVIGVSTVFGIVMLFAGIMLSGMGEGPDLPLALFGSPLTVTHLPIVIAVPVTWIVVGVFVVFANRTLVIAWLIAHAAVAPLAVHAMQEPGHTFSGDVSRLLSIGLFPPALLLWLLYAAGYGSAWWIAVRLKPDTF